ncbi:MAG: hypothetical protein JSW52_12010 [Candidatus Coatesbacteria bacterium]|nr:MAG: hypothetical protein JSW52_12010 [Candidatus Coatesbacteria bacterium]
MERKRINVLYNRKPIENVPGVFIIVLLTIATISAGAIDLPGLPVEITGEISPYYWLNLTETQKEVKGRRVTDTERKYYNGFNVKTAYLGFDFDVTENIDAELTLYYSEDTDDFIRYAYVGLDNLIPRHKLYLGLVKMPWVDYEDGIWGWRNVKHVGVDEFDFVDESDYGIGVEGTVVKGYVQHHVTFTNGRGFEPGGDYYGNERGKDVEYRVTFFLPPTSGFFAGLSINGLVHYGNLFADEYTFYWHAGDVDLTFGPFTELCYGGLVSFEHGFFTLGAGYFEHIRGRILHEYHEDPPYHEPYYKDVKSRLITGYGTAHLSGWFGLLGRFDLVDPDTGRRDEKYTPYWDESFDAYLDVTAGAGFTFYEGHFKFVPNYQTRFPEMRYNIAENQYEDYHPAYFVTTEHRFYVNMDLIF